MTTAPTSDAGGVGFSVARGATPYLLLTLLCLALFAPGLAQLPPLDRDESRFMQATKQMIETGDFVDIRFQDEARNKKPVGIYWLQAAAVMAGGDLTAPWLYRLPSALAAWIAVLATCALGRKLFDPHTGLAAGAMLATTLVVIAEAHIAKTDAALLCGVTFCLAALCEIYRGGRGLGTALLFWGALAVGVLIKGPVIVMIAGATGLALCVADRRLRWLLGLRPLVGATIVAGVTAAWLKLQSTGVVTDPASGGFIAKAFHEDILPKLLGSQEHHGAPPGTYLAMALATAWPWSLLAPFALVAAWRERSSPPVRFCLAWLVPAWVIFELVPTKLPHYTLPLMPPLMLLAGHMVRGARLKALWAGRLSLVYRILWSAVGLALAAGSIIAVRRYGDGAMTAPVLLAVIAFAGAVFALGRLRVTSLAAVGGAFAFTLFAGVLPHLTALTMSPRLAALARPLMGNLPIAVAGYHEPSAVFLLGTATILTDTAAATDHTIAHPGALAVIPADKLTIAQDRLAAAGRVLVRIDEIDGYDYSSGRWEQLHLVSSRPKDAAP